MESRPSSPLALPVRNHAEVDTSRPFSSVKEAVAVFGERLFAGDAHTYVKAEPSNAKLLENRPMPIYSLLPVIPPKPVAIHSATSSPPSYSSASQFIQDRDYDDDDHEFIFLRSLKKLESELEQTKREVMLLKDREAKTEMAVMDLGAQLQRSMSMLAEIESVKASDHEIINLQAIEDEEGTGRRIRSDRWREERLIRDYESSYEYLPSLAQALSINGDVEDELSGRRRMRMMKVAKRKPIIPLIGDLFSKKKGSDDLSSSYYCRSIYSMLS